MKDTFLITGATGFIGSNIVRNLVKHNQHVVILTRDRKLNWRISDITSKIDIKLCDILSPNLSDTIEKIKPTYIFHLASYGVLPTEVEISKMIDTNLKGTANLINAVKQNPFKLFINTGSAFEYGAKNAVMKESDRLDPDNDYGIVKAAATLLCQKEALKYKLPIINLRLFTPFGYYENKNRLVPSVILSAIENRPIRVSSPTFVRDFIFIEDVVNAYVLATQINVKPGEIYNIGSGKQHSVKDIVETVLKITKSRSVVEWGAVDKQARLIEPKRVEASITKSKQDLDWKPKVSIEESLKKTINWFQEHKNQYGS